MKATEQLIENYQNHLAALDRVKELLETLAANNQAAEEVLQRGGTEAEYTAIAFNVDAYSVIDAIRDIMLLKHELNGDLEGARYELSKAQGNN